MGQKETEKKVKRGAGAFATLAAIVVAVLTGRHMQ